MCDTAVAVGRATADGHVIFAKNSDRHPNECQPLAYAPRRQHPAGASLRCQYLEIPQVETTWEVVGARPWWLWGFETGVNEWGVAIGNEAVLSKEPYAETGLLGMDLLRLGLERGRTAYEALHVITDLLERYGQGGSAEVDGVRYYHNAFIVADPREAWVLETAGRYWAAVHVNGARAISNVYSIETHWDESSPDLAEHAIERGWWRADVPFNFARAYQDFSVEIAPRCVRFQRATDLLGRQGGQITAQTMMAHLRDHYDDTFMAPRWSPQELCFSSICMHTSEQYRGETASGMVAELRDEAAPLRSTVWHSFASPCLSAFHPVYLGGAGLPDDLDRGSGTFDPTSAWWRFERLHRRVDAHPALASVLRSLYDNLERRWLKQAPSVEARARDLRDAGEPDGAHRILRDFVDATLIELDAALSQADALLDEAARTAEPPIILQSAHRAALNAAAVLTEPLWEAPVATPAT
ncbi:MAG: C69 family dipeptidase [Chloroflexi bacterium]|nr:C69 family dipeptidase [Chloroflexota bacterium]